MEFLLICFGLCYRNSKIAKSRGQNALVWSLITIVSLVVGLVLASITYVLLFYKGAFEPKAFEEHLRQNALTIFTINIIAAGAGLLVSYILERMPVIDSEK